MFHFFAYLARMKYIMRWGLMRNTQGENIQEHSLQAAMIAHALCMIKNTYFGGNADADKAVSLAVFHEASEVITGDLATPIKYFNPEIQTAYKRIEALASDKLLNMLPKELENAYRPVLCPEDGELKKIVKAADRICAYLKCVEELRAGNSEYEKAKKSILASIQALNRPEVDYFMEHFVPSFDLTLDELN